MMDSIGYMGWNLQRVTLQIYSTIFDPFWNWAAEAAVLTMFPEII